MPRVSIVVVNYNYSKYLDERIQSFLNQTYQDFELFVIDNGSTDSSKEIINKYKDNEKIKIYLFDENIHPFQRWNNAEELAQGEYLLIAAADDSCAPSLLENLVKRLDEHPNVGLAFSQSWDVDPEGKRLYSWKEWTDDIDKDRWSSDFIDSGKNECRNLFLKCTIPNPSGVLLRRNVFLRAGRIDATMKLYGVDWMLYSKMLMISDIAYIAEPLNYFRTPTGGISLRLTLLGNLIEIEESFRVFHYLVKEGIQPPINFWEKVFYPMVKWWARTVFSERKSFYSIIKTYKILREIDPHINRWFFRYTLSFLQEKVTRLYSKISKALG